MSQDQSKQGTQLPATFAACKQKDIQNILTRWSGALSKIAPRQYDIERTITNASWLVFQDYNLRACTLKSVVGGIIKSTQMGLSLMPELGQSWLLPFWNSKIRQKEAVFMIGYKGYLQIYTRLPDVQNVYAHVVRVGDHFDYELGTDPKIVHQPKLGGVGRQIKAAYVVCKMTNGITLLDVLSKNDIDKMYRDHSPGAKKADSPWNIPEWEDSMYTKSMIRRLQRQLPVSMDLGVESDEKVVRVATLPEGEAAQETDFTEDTINEEPGYVDQKDKQEEANKKKAADKAKPPQAKKKKKTAPPTFADYLKEYGSKSENFLITEYLKRVHEATADGEIFDFKAVADSADLEVSYDHIPADEFQIASLQKRDMIRMLFKMDQIIEEKKKKKTSPAKEDGKSSK